MKILWLSHFIPYPPKGGILQRGYHLLKQVASRHEVHLLAFNQADLLTPLFNSLEEGVEESRTHLSTYCKSVEFVPLPLDKSRLTKLTMALTSLLRPQPYTMNWLISDVYKSKIKSLISREKFDFVHFDTISLAPYKYLFEAIPTSLDHHNIESHMLLRRAEKEPNWLKKFYFYQEGVRLEKCEKKLCDTFDFNFTCSDVDTQRLNIISPDSKAYTIPNGVDIDYFNPDSKIIKGNRLIFIGTLSWYPNIEAVLFIAQKIWPLIKKKYPDLEIDIIGANPPKEIVALSKAEPSFKVHGFVDDILPFLHLAKCYVCPIKDGGGTKLKIVDALSIGMAIVADEIACEGIEVTDSKDVLFASTPNEYVDAISTVLDDQLLRGNLQSSARKLAEDNYSYSQIGRQLSDLFTKYQKEQ